MSLTKLFNKNYFVQNILKSKAVIAVMIGIIPILNTIFLMMVSSSVNDVTVANIDLVSVLNIVGMYVLPIILSLCLFGYVFKKKSVDFINSMPLTRKQIFITNSIGGMILIIVMMLINVLLLCIESLLFTNLIIPFAMIIDYFIVWTVAYIFVFTVANVAISISGNHVTMLVVTAIILFFVPFMHNYLTGFNGNLYRPSYYIASTTEEVADSDLVVKDPYVYLDVERIEQDIDYTLPYNYISSIFKGEVKTYSTVSIIKMAVLSIVYFGIGMYLFEKRKMEVNETSFKSNNAHMIVKSLTLIPIGAFALILMNETSSFTANLFILGLIIAYCFIYDLVTTKTIRNFKLGVVYFVATAVLSVGLYYGAEYLNEKVEVKKAFDVDKITSVACYINEVEYSSSFSNGKMSNTYLENETLVNMVKNILNREQQYSEQYLRIRLKLENNEKYEARVHVSDAEYNKIKELALNDDTYEKEYKDIDYSKVQAIYIDDLETLTGNDMTEFLSKIKNAMDNIDLSHASTLPNIEHVTLVLYQNHNIIEYDIPLNISQDLLKEYVDMSNKRAADFDKVYFRVYNARIFNDNNYPDDFYELFIDDEIREYVKEYINNNQNEQVDVTKPLLVIYANAENDDKDDYSYIQIKYFTNNVVELVQEVNNIINARGDLDE